MNNNIDWTHAPEDATHTGSSSLQDRPIKIWYKYEQYDDGSPIWSYWYSDNGILDSTGWLKLPKGGIPSHLPLIPRPGYKAPPIQTWKPGRDLPPIGEVVSFTQTLKADEGTLFKKGIDAGTECTIVAHFMSHGTPIAAFTYKLDDGSTIIRQAIAAGFTTRKTPEEIAAEEKKAKRTACVEKILEDFGLPRHGDQRQLLKDLYDKGYLEP